MVEAAVVLFYFERIYTYFDTITVGPREKNYVRVAGGWIDRRGKDDDRIGRGGVPLNFHYRQGLTTTSIFEYRFIRGPFAILPNRTAYIRHSGTIIIPVIKSTIELP